VLLAERPLRFGAIDQAAGASLTVRGLLKVSADPWFARVLLAPRLPN
jgi:hypothetical protein